MRAILRGMAVLVAGGLWLTSAAALAQDATTNTTPPSTVGPSELQNFSLSGNVTKPSNEQGAPASAAAKPAPAPASGETAGSTPPAARRVIQTREQSRQSSIAVPAPARAVTQSVDAAPAPVQPRPSSPGLAPTAEASSTAAPQSSLSPPSLPLAPPAGLTADHKLSILPWLIAAFLLTGGTIFLLWFRRSRQALVGTELDLFAAPEPEPAPTPAPEAARAPAPTAPRPLAPRAPSGIVASRLRPSLELDVQPLRCVVDDNQVIIEFALELFNAGTAPARAVLAEASLLNAGATQDRELAAFFASPVGAGERLDSIPPMNRINLTSRVVAPRNAIQEYELAGKKTFVPVIGFNALYEWSGGKAQTSSAYLIGRETRSDKLGPLRLDLGPREFGSLAARELPTAVRT